MDKWGNLMYQAIDTIAEMAAIGMSVAKDTFTKRMKGGAHLLAPTGSDLEKNNVGTVFAGWHYDITVVLCLKGWNINLYFYKKEP